MGGLGRSRDPADRPRVVVDEMGKVALALLLAMASVGLARPAAADDRPIFNQAQVIVAQLPGPVPMYFGEAGYLPLALQSPFFDITQYALNGQALDGASVGCWTSHIVGDAIAWDVCDSVRVALGRDTLVAGGAYRLTVGDIELGTFVAQGIGDRTPPSVVAVVASQYSFEVTFSKPMRLDRPCGGDGYAAFSASGTGPYANDLGHYTSPDPGFDAVLHEFHTLRSSADCTTFAFFARWLGAAAGTYELDIAGAEDVDGNALPPTAVTVSFDDERAPSLIQVWSRSDDYVATQLELIFDEPLDAASVADLAGYRLNGAPLPPTSSAECFDDLCATVAVFVPSPVVRRGENTVVATRIRDLAGKLVDPSANSWTWQGY